MGRARTCWVAHLQFQLHHAVLGDTGCFLKQRSLQSNQLTEIVAVTATQHAPLPNLKVHVREICMPTVLLVILSILITHGSNFSASLQSLC